METLKSLRIKAKDAGIKYYYRMNMKELISALFLNGISPYDYESESLSETQKVILDDIQGSMTYDEAIQALADVFPEKRKRLFVPSPFSKFRKMFIGVLENCCNDILLSIIRNNINPIIVDGHRSNFKSRSEFICSLAKALEWHMFSIFRTDDDAFYDSIMNLYDGNDICRLQVLWLSKKTGKDYTSMKKS